MTQVGKNHEDYKNVQLCVDGWSVKTVVNYDTSKHKWEDVLDNTMKEVSHINSEKYSGQIISNDSKNIKSITKLRNKGIGLKNKVIQMLHSGGEVVVMKVHHIKAWNF